MERVVSNTDWFVFAWLLSLVLVTATKITNEVKFAEFISIAINKKFFLTAQREDNYLFNWFNAILFVAQIISLSLFIFLLTQQFYAVSEQDIGFFLKIVGFLSSFALLKFLFEKLIGFVVGFGEFVNQFNFIKLSFRNNIAVFFILIDIILYLVDSLTNIYLYASMSIYLIISTLGFARMFNYFQKEIPPHFFYFILYLCALEIAPYAILYKLLLD